MFIHFRRAAGKEGCTHYYLMESSTRTYHYITMYCTASLQFSLFQLLGVPSPSQDLRSVHLHPRSQTYSSVASTHHRSQIYSSVQFAKRCCFSRLLWLFRLHSSSLRNLSVQLLETWTSTKTGLNLNKHSHIKLLAY